MGLPKLSNKCKKCGYKNTCDDKRMEACSYTNPSPLKFATGGMVSNEDMVTIRERIEGCTININPSLLNDAIIKALQDALIKVGGLK